MKEHYPFRFPPKNILVALDLSEASMRAWEHAGLLARRFGAKVKGIYVQPWLYTAFDVYISAPLPDTRATMATTQASLKQLKARLGPDADIEAVPGEPERTILSWGKEPSYDLIVAGTHGRSGLARALQGSVAEAILRHATIPVLIARDKPRLWRRVLSPVNFEAYSMEGLRAACRVAESLGASLTALHVVSAPLYGEPTALDGPRALLADALKTLPRAAREACRPSARVTVGDPAEEIAAAAETADLTVLMAHRKGFLSDTVLGTTAERVLRHSRGPVLAIPSDMAPARRRGYGAARRHAAVR